MTAGGMLSSKLFGNYKYDLGASRLDNTLAEIGHSSISGAYSRAFGGMISNALNKKNIFKGMGQNFISGAAGGLSSAVGKDLLIGTPRALSTNKKVQMAISGGNKAFGIKNEPLYRSGGLWGLGSSRFKLFGHEIQLLPNGFAGFGRDLLANASADDAYTWIHETAHHWQYELYGYGNVSGALALEQLFIGNPYTTAGTYESYANFAAKWWRIFY